MDNVGQLFWAWFSFLRKSTDEIVEPFVLKLTGQHISACNCTYQLRGSDITGLSCKQTVGQSQLGILGSWAIFSSKIERVLLGQ